MSIAPWFVVEYRFKTLYVSDAEPKIVPILTPTKSFVIICIFNQHQQ